MFVYTGSAIFVYIGYRKHSFENGTPTQPYELSVYFTFTIHNILGEFHKTEMSTNHVHQLRLNENSIHGKLTVRHHPKGRRQLKQKIPHRKR